MDSFELDDFMDIKSSVLNKMCESISTPSLRLARAGPRSSSTVAVVAVRKPGLAGVNGTLGLIPRRQLFTF